MTPTPCRYPPPPPKSVQRGGRTLIQNHRITPWAPCGPAAYLHRGSSHVQLLPNGNNFLEVQNEIMNLIMGDSIWLEFQGVPIHQCSYRGFDWGICLKAGCVVLNIYIYIYMYICIYV